MHQTPPNESSARRCLLGAISWQEHRGSSGHQDCFPPHAQTQSLLHHKDAGLQKIPKLPFVQGNMGRKWQEGFRAQSPAPLSTPGSLSCGARQDLNQMGEGAAEPTSWENVGAHGSHGHTVLSAADPAMQEWLGAHLRTGVLGTSLPWSTCQEDEGSK